MALGIMHASAQAQSGVISPASSTQLQLDDVPSEGVQFSIASEIYVDRKAEPVSRNLTLFAEKAVVDFSYAAGSDEPREIVIFDMESGDVRLLDPIRGVQVAISEQQLLQLVHMLRQDEYLREKLNFLVEPMFDVQIEEDAVTLASEFIQYACQGTVVDDRPQQMNSYYAFLDQLTRLNATDPGKLPPFARLKLNEKIREARLMPNSVEVSIDLPAELGKRAIHARSQHEVTWQPDSANSKLMVTAKKMLGEFEQVELEVYRNVR